LSASFAGRAAVVTGASTGIGNALARALAREGCRVGLIARRRDLLDALAAEIKGAGGVVAAATADVGDLAQVRGAIAALADAHGPADLLVANAGVGRFTALDPVNIDAVEETIRVNLLGVIYAIEAVLPAMLARGSGHIAAVSSLAAYRGFPGDSAYCASKAAVNVYLEGLRVQGQRRGIVVTTICPGYVHTPMTAGNPFTMPFVMGADEAAALIVRALQRRRKVYNFPWPTALLVKLARWAPDWLIAAAFGRLDNPPQTAIAAERRSAEAAPLAARGE
jgi:short-subunit dehydrogenase